MRERRRKGPSGAAAASKPAENGERRALYLFAFLDAERALPSSRRQGNRGEVFPPPSSPPSSPPFSPPRESDPSASPGESDPFAPPGESDPFPPPAIARCGKIAALFSRVRVAEYCGAQAQDRLRDRDWVLRRTLAHAALLQSAMRSSPVYPVPFGTLFTSRERLTRFLRANEERIGDFLRRVAGMEEWELKAEAGFAGVGALEALGRSARPEWSALPAGTRYMLLCRERPALLAAAFEEAERRMEAWIGRLLPAALRRLPAAASAGGGGDHWAARFALLLRASEAEARQKEMERLAEEAAESRITLRLSGPWPPFSFRPDLPALHEAGASARRRVASE